MLTYLSEVEHVKAFRELKTVLNVSNGAIKSTLLAKDEEILALRSEVEKLRLTLKGMIETFGEDIAQKALSKFRESQTVTDEQRAHGYRAQVEAPKDVLELLREVGKLKEAKELEEYKRLIENGNGNGEHA